MSTSPPGSHSFSLLVPLKQLSRSKTRLATGADRADLMRAFVRDALEAAVSSPVVAQVYLVTEETDLAIAGVEQLADPGPGELNADLRYAERQVRLRHPDRAVAAMCGDLPTLRTDDLTAALRTSSSPRWYVADAAGTGTTLLAAAPGVDLDPHFGTDSARRHEVSGARPLRADVVTLRHDVDTREDLEGAVALGLGRHTRAAIRR